MPFTYIHMTHPGLDEHNTLRALHDVPPLHWNPDMAALAKQYADLLIHNNTFEHGMLVDAHGKRMGQNLAWGTSPTYGVKDAIMAWYNEGTHYNYSTPSFNPATAHFTQLVWKSTTDVGIGIATDGHKTIVVANYMPPGNANRTFLQNVLPLHTLP